MRKLTALVFAVALVFGMASMANAQATYTWTVINTPGAHEIWPNQANSANIFEADTGLLGRVVVDGGTDTPVLGTGANSCELAPSYDCNAGNPPVFLLPAGGAEGPTDAGGQSECNRVVIACNAAPIPTPGHAAAAGEHTAGLGSYSYLVLHTPTQPGVGTNPPTPAGKGISFFSGSFVIEQQLYKCNDCPAGGFGKDINDQIALDNTGPGAIAQSQSVTLWITQATQPFGHAQITLQAAGAGAGKISACGTGVVFQTLDTDLCVDGLSVGGNFTIPDQKVVAHTYSVNLAQHANFGNPGACNPPDCYIEQVIIPAALTANSLNQNVQVQSASSVLPPDAPGSLANGTVDSLLYFATTQLLDIDGDGTEDRVDPCPNDPANGCLADLVMGGACPSGTVFCTDSTGVAGCRNAQLCWTRRDTNADCSVSSADLLDVGASQLFNVPLPVGPFDP